MTSTKIVASSLWAESQMEKYRQNPMQSVHNSNNRDGHCCAWCVVGSVWDLMRSLMLSRWVEISIWPYSNRTSLQLAASYKASPSLLLKVTTNLDIIRQRSPSTVYNSFIIITCDPQTYGTCRSAKALCVVYQNWFLKRKLKVSEGTLQHNFTSVYMPCEVKEYLWIESSTAFVATACDMQKKSGDQ